MAIISEIKKQSGILTATFNVDTTVNTIKSAFQSDSEQIINNVSLKEGDCCIMAEQNSNVYISNGELIISATDANSYSLNSNGDLIYTY